ncbi:MAG: META domain-containing protein [Fidelibacterota bacterium]|nr:MAG: META domain-containing protein [Candidatus Neomarinimicrobiota bacterium]
MKPAALYYLSALLLKAVIACSSPTDSIIDEDLLSGVWKVDTLITPEVKIVPEPDTLMTIRFNSAMEVRGSLSCNQYEGNYEVNKNGSISITITAITAMACPQWRILEYSFANTHENVTAYNLGDNRLNLFDAISRYIVNLSGE